MTQTSDPRTDQLPAAISGFLAASVVHDADAAEAFLADDVVVVDQGESFRGLQEVHAFVRDAGAEFDYTTEQVGAHRVDDEHWVVVLRLEGSFPGGVAELDYRFSLHDARVSELVIANHVA